jgi:tyrosyl-tRNA synthetase
VWLNKEMLSVYDYWQFWRNTEDRDVGRFLRLFTDLPLDEIARLEGLEGAELNETKKVLATEATAILHGREAAEQAAETARRAFEEGAMAEGLPIVQMDWSAGEVTGEHGWTQRRAEAIVKASGLATSLSDARRKITLDKGVRINDRQIDDPSQWFAKTDVDPQTGAFKVQYGKKKIVLVKPV